MLYYIIFALTLNLSIMLPINLFNYGPESRHYNYVIFDPRFDGFECHFVFSCARTRELGIRIAQRRYTQTAIIHSVMTFRQAAKLYPHLFSYKSK